MRVTDLPPDRFDEAVDLWHEAGLTRPWNNPRDDLLRAVQGSASTVLACLEDQRLLGTAMVGHDGHRGWVYYMAVREDERGRGVGRRLLNACEEWVVARGIPKVQLMVRDDNAAAVEFYERMGYERSAIAVLGRRLDGQAHTRVPVPPQDEQVLAEHGLTRVVRVGDTVRRPVRPFTATVQAYLQHLWAQGADFVPEPLGFDDQGREVLRFVPGEVPVEPLPDWATGENVLVALARLIRRLHEAAAGWAAPADAVWGTLPGASAVELPPLFDAPELVSHQDYCPGNVVFRDRLPAALIDFDLARPTSRVADCVNALYWWVPLLHPLDRAPALQTADAAARVRIFADTYGMDAEQRAQIVPVAIRRASTAHVSMRAAAEADPVFRRWWDEGVKDRMPRAEQWLAQERTALERVLLP